MLQFLKRFCFNLSYSFASYTHHFTDFFKGKGAEVTGDPGAVEKRFIFQSPLTCDVLTDFSNKIASFFAFIQSVHRRVSFIVSSPLKIRIPLSFVNA
jgi:hypothetical protein